MWFVIFQEDAAHIVARFAAHDRVIDADSTVDKVERGVEDLFGQALCTARRQ